MKKIYLLAIFLIGLLASCNLQGYIRHVDGDELEALESVKPLKELLQEQGLDNTEVTEQMSESVEYLLLEAVKKAWLPIIKKLLGEGSVAVDITDDKGNTPLHWAARYGYTEIVRLLLGNNAQVDIKTDLGTTPLHWAAWGGHTKVASLLLNKKAAVDSKNKIAASPLHYAAQFGHIEVAALLLAHGADLTIKDNGGDTALQLAQSNNRSETTAFLELAADKSKEWLEAYYKGFSYKKDHEEDEKKLHTYARVYAEMYEEQKDHDLVFTAMPYYFQYLEEDKLSHEEAKEGAIMMVHCI